VTKPQTVGKNGNLLRGKTLKNRKRREMAGMTRDEAHLAARKKSHSNISVTKTNNKRQGIMSGKFFKECTLAFLCK